MEEERIAALYQLLDCNNAKIARAAGYSPSEISRVRNGTRKYGPTSRPALRFAEGIYVYADQSGAVRPLSALCGAEGQTREEVVPVLAAWLFGKKPMEVPAFLPMVMEGLHEAKEKRKRSFGEKLGETMELLGISASRLAARLSVDPSTVRRFRSGVRSPKPPMDQHIVSALIERARTQDGRRRLAKLCGVPEESMDENALSSWLFESRDTLGYSFSHIDELLDAIEQAPVPAQPARQHPGVPVAQEVPDDARDLYWGIGGLREAVARFLLEAIQEGGELLLYSDQGMEWMTGDPGFHAKWSSLMAACVRSGTKIRIIHNTDRDIPEMISAIRSWLPLYMSGTIKPYVCRLGTDNRFSKTIFLRPGGACVLASCLRGSEDTGRYEYLADRRSLDSVESEFHKLLDSCVPLLDVYLDNAAVPFTADKSHDDIQLLLPGPSIASMPEETLLALLERNGIRESELERIRHARASQAEWLGKRLADGKVREFVTLPSDEFLFNGEARIDLARSLCDRELSYTPEEFASHAEAMIGLVRDFANYEAVFLPEQPFAQIRIVATGSRVSVIRTGKPYIDFVFSEPRLVKAFHGYFDALAKQYETDRADVIARLSRYL